MENSDLPKSKIFFSPTLYGFRDDAPHVFVCACVYRLVIFYILSVCNVNYCLFADEICNIEVSFNIKI